MITLLAGLLNGVFNVEVEAENIGVIEHPADHGLEAGNSDRLADIGDIEPHIFIQPQGGPSFFAGRRQKEGDHLILPLFDGIEDEFLGFAVRLDID